MQEHGQIRVHYQRESKRSFRVTSSSGTVGLKRARRLTLINPLLEGQRSGERSLWPVKLARSNETRREQLGERTDAEDSGPGLLADD